MFRVLRGSFAKYPANLRENTVILSQKLLFPSRVLRDMPKGAKQLTNKLVCIMRNPPVVWKFCRPFGTYIASNKNPALKHARVMLGYIRMSLRDNGSRLRSPHQSCAYGK